MSGFRAFLARGNVLDLAVAVIIGAAFGAIVSSMADDLIMPVIGWLFGGLDFSSYFVRLGPVPAGYKGALNDYAALKAAGVPMLGYGQFVSAVVKFLVLALVIYQLVRIAQRFQRQEEAAAEAPREDVILLREIRDLLKGRG